VMRCLAKSPDHRYPTMDAVAADLEQLERSLPTPATQSGAVVITALHPPPPRWPLYVMLGVGMLMLSVIAVVLAVKLGR